MLSNEAVNASRMIDMHVSVYEAKCDNPLAHIRVRTARGKISRYWSSYIKLNYLLSSDSIRFLVFSSDSRMLDCELAPRPYIRLYFTISCLHTINSFSFSAINLTQVYIYTCFSSIYRIVVRKGRKQ